MAETPFDPDIVMKAKGKAYTKKIDTHLDAWGDQITQLKVRLCKAEAEAEVKNRLPRNLLTEDSL